MSTYLDASFAASLYYPDSNTPSAVAHLQGATRPLLVSSLCEIESTNAFRLAVFRKKSTSDEAQHFLRKFSLHLDTGVLARIPVTQAAFLRAGELSAQYTTQFGTRGADIVHVACALEVGAGAFFSFDLQQRNLAAAVGLALNPL